MSILKGLEAPVYSFIWLRPGPRLEEQELCGALTTAVEGKGSVVKPALNPKTTDYISWSKQQAPLNGALQS